MQEVGGVVVAEVDGECGWTLVGSAGRLLDARAGWLLACRARRQVFRPRCLQRHHRLQHRRQCRRVCLWETVVQENFIMMTRGGRDCLDCDCDLDDDGWLSERDCI